MAQANFLFNGLGDKADRLTHLDLCTDMKIEERISASTSSCTKKLAEDTFRPGIIFESFHHQARTPVSNRALLGRFLMLRLKRCIMPTLLHEVIVADVVYLAVLLAFGWDIGLLPMMVGCIQSGLQELTKTFCKVKVMVDADGNALTDEHGNPEVKVPNPRIELPYSYLVAWYVMHCPSLMTPTYTSKDLVPFLQKSEHSSWQHTHIFYIRIAIQIGSNY